jgi:hypothetical protein
MKWFISDRSANLRLFHTVVIKLKMYLAVWEMIDVRSQITDACQGQNDEDGSYLKTG